MAVNNNFYATINELVNRASKGEIGAVVDYSSFIDVGKTLADMTQGDRDAFMNNFANEIANKVKISIDTARDYQGKFKSLIRGTASPNAVIEIVTHGFFETRQALFVNLQNNGSVDMYKINKGSQSVRYYTKDNTYTIPVTIQSLELEGAFQSPEKMNAFLQNKIRYAMNSNESAREQGRRGLMADLICELSDATEATSADVNAQRYNLLQLYYDIYGIELTADTALHNGEFVRFAVQQIKKVRRKMAERSDAFNISGVETFTPESENELFVHSGLAAGIDTYLYQDARRPETLGDFEEVNYWQNSDTPYIVTHGEEGDLNTLPIVAVAIDRFAAGEWVCHEAVNTTPYNAAGEYYNIWINVQTKYVRNADANAVIFELGDIVKG